jgi:hypothetical protein
LREHPAWALGKLGAAAPNVNERRIDAAMAGGAVRCGRFYHFRFGSLLSPISTESFVIAPHNVDGIRSRRSPRDLIATADD